MTSREYIGVAETAKLVRASLKEAFPGVKFSVRSSSYAGGASIRASWIDGPTSAQVKTVTRVFEGGYFDGMIDYKGSRYALLDGKPVKFGADFLFEERSNSDASVLAAFDSIVDENWIGASYPARDEIVAKFRNGDLYSVPLYEGANRGGDSLQDALFRRMGETSSYPNAKPSPTVERVKSAGDDGYGAGTVGSDPENPNGSQAYVAMEQARRK